MGKKRGRREGKGDEGRKRGGGKKEEERNRNWSGRIEERIYRKRRKFNGK